MAKEPKQQSGSSFSNDPDIQAAMNAVLMAGGSGGTLTPIGGAPTGYAQKPTAEREERNVVRYFKGDERLPAYLDSRQVTELQIKLIQAGLLDDDFRRGVYDDSTEKAYESLLSFANASGLDKDDALLRYMEGEAQEIDPATGKPRKRSAGGVKRAPLTIRYANPQDVASMADEVASRRLGRKFRPEEMQKFISAYQGQEAQSQKAEYAAGAAGGSYTAAPSVDTMAENFAEQTDPDQAFARRLMDYTGHINSLLGGIIPGAPRGTE